MPDVSARYLRPGISVALDADRLPDNRHSCDCDRRNTDRVHGDKEEFTPEVVRRREVIVYAFVQTEVICVAQSNSAGSGLSKS